MYFNNNKNNNFYLLKKSLHKVPNPKLLGFEFITQNNACHCVFDKVTYVSLSMQSKYNSPFVQIRQHSDFLFITTRGCSNGLLRSNRFVFFKNKKTPIKDKYFSTFHNVSQVERSEFFETNNFWNLSFDKGRIKILVSWFLKTYGQKKTIQLVENLKNIGFE